MAMPAWKGSCGCVPVQSNTKSICTGDGMVTMPWAQHHRDNGPTVFSPANSIPAGTATEVWQFAISLRLLYIQAHKGLFCISHGPLEMTTGVSLVMK